MAKEITMAKHKKILLSLSTLAPEPQFIEIDGKNYDLQLLDQLGLKEQARIGAMASRAENIKMTADLTDEVVDDLIDLYQSLVRNVMPTLPAEVLGKLRVPQLQAITVIFTEASGIKIPTDDKPVVLGAPTK